jgi:transposase
MRKKNSSVDSQPASFCREERTSTTSPLNGIVSAAGGVAKNHREPSDADVAAPAAHEPAPAHDLIKLSIDVHLAFCMVARQVDNAVAQPPQKFDEGQLLRFIAKQKSMARRVVCCYEAGCFGYGLHRKIEALGAENLVVAPQDWDERKVGVKTDRTDTSAMLSRLDRYLAGNHKALAVVRVPGLAEEVARSRVRERKQFQSDRNRWANQGKSLLLQYGLKCGWSWWQPDRYEKTRQAVREALPAELAGVILRMLGDLQEMVLKLAEKLEELTKEQQKHVREARAANQKTTDKESADKESAGQDAAGKDATGKDAAGRGAATYRIKGIGELSIAQIQAEVGDWNRFANRRQVSSYTGLCPGVCGSGGNFTGLSITKHGNQRLRAALVEVAWLIVRYQAHYPPAKQCRLVLAGKNRSAKKKAIVALARKLAVDLWRIGTGKLTPEKLGLELSKAA